jgi:hypothetical protein
MSEHPKTGDDNRGIQSMNEELAPRRIVSIKDDGQATAMEVYLELDFDGKAYGIALPNDLPILLVSRLEDEEGEYLEPIDYAETKGLKASLTEATRAWNVKPEFRNDEVYLVGDYPEDFLEDCEHIEVHVEDGTEEYARLLDLEDGENTYLIITPLVPDMYPFEFVDEENGRLLDDDELSQLEELFREALHAVEGEV